MFQGCLFTQSYTKNIRSSVHFGKEFVRFNGHTKLYKGVAVEGSESGDSGKIHLQFADVLDGKNRILNILCDKQNLEYPDIFETRSMEKGKPAYLNIRRYVSMDSVDKKCDPFDPTYLPEQSPDSFLSCKGIAHRENTFPLIAAELNFGSVYSVPFTLIVWDRQTDGAAEVFRNFAFLEQAPRYPHLKRKKRNVLITGIAYFGYLIVVPLDIITCPFQLFLLRGMVK